LRNVDRYLKLVKWARNRYTRNKILIMSSGNVPSIYVRIVSAAWSKYMVEKACSSTQTLRKQLSIL
jgi:hypothetical protein